MMMFSKHRLLLLAISACVLAPGAVLWATYSAKERSLRVTSFDECAAAGYPIMESYPEQCRTPDDRTFVRVVPPGNVNSTTIPSMSGAEAASFGAPIMLRVGAHAVFPDGFTLTVKEIGDSRCKPGLQCFWAGEITVLLGAASNGTSEEVRLGTTTKKTVSAKDHTITLQSGTPESVTLVVE